MGRKSKKEFTPVSCDEAVDVTLSSCKVESIVSMDDRGQMVLPKELREKAGIRAGDKLVALSGHRDGGVCCITLIKSDFFSSALKNMLLPRPIPSR